MEFLKACASRLDAGASAEDILSEMRLHYTTAQCLSVKTCLVRNMCTPSVAYSTAMEELCASFPDERDEILTGRCSNPEVQTRIKQLPPKWNENVYRLKPTRLQMKECKRLSAHSAIRKNQSRVRVCGREMLRRARHIIQTCDGQNLVNLAFALMLVTGRRTCEILNGRSQFQVHNEYSVLFTGIAKRRGRTSTILVPVLARADAVCHAVTSLRTLQKNTCLSNRETSLRYQSLLSRHLMDEPPWKECKRVHGLRGVYACMALKLFRWEGDASDAYLAMCILGHTGLQESLVYTTYHLGDDFSQEESLGEGQFTPHQAVGVTLDV